MTLQHFTIADLQRALHDGELSARETARQTLDDIAPVNPPSNARAGGPAAGGGKRPAGGVGRPRGGGGRGGGGGAAITSRRCAWIAAIIWRCAAWPTSIAP
ncbi:hypothetical protein M8371_29045, partial [Klebsiella pneumoniae]|nr:hypothetical protein [Klebsiella pneumoniae]